MADHTLTNGVYAAVYSGIQVYEMLCRGVAVMRRRSDSWLNATQLLKVAGIDKGRRTKILEREVLTGTHEKIQGGYGKYQGTWVPFTRGVQLCRQYAIYEYVRVILEHDPTESGTRPDKTPTKAEVRRYQKITQRSAARTTNGAPASIKRDRPVGGAPTNKRHRAASSAATSPLNSDVLGGYQSVVAVGHGVPSTPGYLHDDRFESVPQLASSATHFRHSLYSSPAVSYSADAPANLPNSAWQYRAGNEELSSQTIAEGDAGALGGDTSAQDDQIKLMQIFLNEDAGFIPDWLAELDGEAGPSAADGTKSPRVNVDLVIDDQGHTAVHWAAALARIQVLDLLLFHSADARRLNYDGESALVRAVQVTNNYETQTFPELLELLHDTIPLTDKHNRTVLHHIALAAGIEGREKAARYYADCLLSWIVRLAGGYQIDAGEDGAASAASTEQLGSVGGASQAGAKEPPSSPDEPAKALPTPNQSSSPNGHAERLGDEDPLTASGDSGSNADFAAFLNLQDVHGNTALNLAARVGDRAMVRMLLNAGASSTIPNRVGLCPLDFGADQIAQADGGGELWAGDLLGDEGLPDPPGAMSRATGGGGGPASVLDAATSPMPAGRSRAPMPQTPLRSAVRGANKSLLSSLMAGCGEPSPLRSRSNALGGPAGGEPGPADAMWSPVSAEQRVHQSVAKIQRLMSDLESDFAGEIKNKQSHFDEIKQQLRNTTIELAKARETIHKLHAKSSQLNEIQTRVGFLEETLARETCAVREAISSLPADSKPRKDLEDLLDSILDGAGPDGVPADAEAEADLPRIPGNVFDTRPGEDAGEAEQEPARLCEMVERLRVVNQVYARRDALLRERVAALRKRADVSERERQYRQIIASCCEISEADVDIWIDKLVSAVESGGPSDGNEPLPAAVNGQPGGPPSTNGLAA
ncbi:transcriptional regulator swi6 [Coemansia biformis]|uniref:Transcriptional regulator swi6 n=1 Tax=Coemansia biformis TaxID=1286918 RepID=A0A9W8D154_9FUNG|nr:transcriptional regulator swi6 [Coemansia biformis]